MIIKCTYNQHNTIITLKITFDFKWHEKVFFQINFQESKNLSSYRDYQNKCFSPPKIVQV